jgi:hypothetical protein
MRMLLGSSRLACFCCVALEKRKLCAAAAAAAMSLQVAVKVLDGHAVLRRDETTGFSLEALLSEQLKVRDSLCIV